MARTGRPVTNREKFTERFPLYFKPSVLGEMRERSEAGIIGSVNGYVHSLVEQDLAADPSAKPLHLKFIQTAPCGEWSDADAAQDDTFEVSPDLVKMWTAIPGDLILHTRGSSMLGAGIPAEALLHMRPFGLRSPRDGQVCAILALDKNGAAKGTVKHWTWGGERNIELRDGDWKKFDVPEGTVEIIANAFWVGGLIGLPQL